MSKIYYNDNIVKGDVIYCARLKKEMDIIISIYGNEHMKIISSYKDQFIKSSGLYRHYGVYIGNNEVIHFQGKLKEGWNTYKIIKTSVEEFSKGDTINKCYRAKYNYSKDDVVKRAISQIGSKWGGYHFFNNNCEHFSTWCCSGVKSSSQVSYRNEGENILEKGISKILEPVRALREQLDRDL